MRTIYLRSRVADFMRSVRHATYYAGGTKPYTTFYSPNTIPVSWIPYVLCIVQTTSRKLLLATVVYGNIGLYLPPQLVMLRI